MGIGNSTANSNRTEDESSEITEDERRRQAAYDREAYMINLRIQENNSEAAKLQAQTAYLSAQTNAVRVDTQVAAARENPEILIKLIDRETAEEEQRIRAKDEEEKRKTMELEQKLKTEDEEQKRKTMELERELRTRDIEIENAARKETEDRLREEFEQRLELERKDKQAYIETSMKTLTEIIEQHDRARK